MRSVLLLSVAGVLFTSSALAWGPDGHRMISTLAVQRLPEEVPAFLRSPEAAAEAGYLGPEADRERGGGKSFDDEHAPGHFVDVDDDLTIHGGPRLDALPVSREAYDYALNAKKTNQYRMGYLPYSIEQGFQLLAKDLAYWRVDMWGEKNGKTEAERAWYAKDRIMRERIALHDLGTWSHYVADGSNPMHASVHFNGWGKFPNPEGFTQEKIHTPFESPYVHANIAENDIAPFVPAYRDCSCDIHKRTAEFLIADQADLLPLFRLWKTGAFDKPTAEGKAFVAKRLAVGVAELRDMIVDAWRQSDSLGVGYPEKKVSDVEAGKADPFVDLTY